MSNFPKLNHKKVPNHMLLKKPSNKINLKPTVRSNVILHKLDVNKQSQMDITDEPIDISDSDSDSIKCVVCNENFCDKLNLRKHITQSHPEISDLVFCDLCNESFLTEDELREHISNDHDDNINTKKETIQHISSNTIKKPKKLKHRRLYYLKKYLQVTNQLFGKFDNRTEVRNTQRRIARRKWIRKQLELNKNSSNASVSVKDDDTMDTDKNNLQYPTSTVEIEECPDKAENTDKIENVSGPKEYKNDVYNDCDKKLKLSQEAVADSSVSNHTPFDSCKESSVENNGLTSIKKNSIKIISSIQLVNMSDNSFINKKADGDDDDDETDYVVKKKSSSNNIYKESSGNNINRLSNVNSTTSSQEFRKKIITIDGKISRIPVLPPKLSACRTYMEKSFPQVVQKKKINVKSNGERNAVYCYMCNEIFCLMDQKCTKVFDGEKEVIKCLFCNRKFSLKTTLEKHVAYSHLNCECIKNLKPVKTFSTTDQNFDQGNGAIDNANYECPICLRTFITYYKFNNHILNAHEIMSPFKERLTIGKPEYLRRISISNFLCKSISNDGVPMKNIINNKNTVIKCMSCELIFASCKGYIDHIKKSHGNMKPIQESSWYPFKVTNTETGSSTLRFFQNLSGKNFLSDNTGEKNFHKLRKTCKRCNREFDSIRELSKHFYLVHEDPNDNQPVPVKTTTISTTIPAAVAGEKRTHDWYCLHCSQRFKVLQSYIRHRYFVHDDESMVHICENCCKILTSLEMVNLHVCSNVTSWACKQCNESFSSAIALRLHNSEMHYELAGPYICSTCEKKFLTKAMLIRHVQMKNCYSHVCPPEPSEIVTNSTINIDSLIAQSEDSFNHANITESKQNKELTSISNFENVEVLQEDALLRGSIDEDTIRTFDSSVETKKSEEDKIYQCSMCKLYFLSKSGLKLHINRAHTSAVEICQLCYRMYDTGNLVRHVINSHLERDKGNEAKTVDSHQVKEHDIEKDTEKLIKLLGTKHLLALCEYQRHLELNDHIACPRCSLTFENSEQYRVHNAKIHDKLCALCNVNFETGPEAADHKSKAHGSIPCYVWFAHKIILAIGDTKTFEETAEKIIVETMSCDNAEEVNDASLEDENCMSESQEDVDHESSILSNENTEEHDQEQQMILTIDPDVSVEPSDDEDDLRLFLVITEQDLEKYKHDLKQLAKQISSACNIFSTDDIEKLLQLYLKK